ncbi:MAG: hypothetical protein R2991_06280 [Thermoanaerobaculia bacterium]
MRDERSPERPAVDTLSWLQESDGTARWFSLDRASDAWTRDLVGDRADLPASLGLGRDVLTGPARALDLPRPTILVDEDETAGGRRRLAVTVRSERGAPVLRAFLRSDSAMTGLRVGGAPVDAASLSAGGVRLALYGFEDAAVRMELELDGEGPVEIEVLDQAWGLPADQLPRPRPPDVIPRPGWLTDSTFTVARQRL